MMLYRIGKEEEIKNIAGLFPCDVIAELLEYTHILEEEYGTDRNYLRTGGYSVMTETTEDLAAFSEVIDFEEDLCEWVRQIGEYLSVLYMLGDDYSIVVFMPISIAPETVLREIR